VVGCTIGSSGEVPGERKPVIRDDDDDDDDKKKKKKEEEEENRGMRDVYIFSHFFSIRSLIIKMIS
jgi:hypothetical protein